MIKLVLKKQFIKVQGEVNVKFHFIQDKFRSLMEVLTIKHRKNYKSGILQSGEIMRQNSATFSTPSEHQTGTNKVKAKKGKESHNRPLVAQMVPGALGFQISMAFGT
jgi:hypothetical protein